MGSITFRKPPTRRIASALAAATTALFGWLSQPNAEVIHYRIAGARASFSQIPDPPPLAAVITIEGYFDFDAATQIQTNVRLRVTGNLQPGDYASVLPRKAVSLPSSCALCDITAGRPPEGGTVQKFAEEITISFAQPLDGTSTFIPIRKVFIDGFGNARTPCTRTPGCQTTVVTGSAEAVRGRELPVLEFQMVRSAAQCAPQATVP